MRKLIGALALVAMLITVIGSLMASAQVPQESDFDTWEFARTWARTDLPVAEGKVNRTWMWGPGPETHRFTEKYVEAPNGERNVQYFDKSRMEDARWNTTEAPWDVTNGLLSSELITGRMQLGNYTFQQYCPSTVNIAGDPVPVNPTYATFSKLILVPAHGNGSVITATVDKAGNVGDEQSVAKYGVKAVSVGAPTGHTVASVFWDFMNSEGLVYNANYSKYQDHQKLFTNPFYATGYPITEAYWSEVVVAGTLKPVLTQAFERRVLTYTPDNPHGWQVEAGNVGLHYYQWRHEGIGLTDCKGDGHGPDPVHEPKPPVKTPVTHVDLGKCTQFPNESIDELARAVFDKVEAGQLVSDGKRTSAGFHPIYKPSAYAKNSNEGQYSWFFSYCVAMEEGGEFHQWNGADGQFVFRHNDVNAEHVIVIRTTAQFKEQFMDGEKGRASINVKTNPFGQVLFVAKDGSVFCPEEYQENECRASKDGDMLVQVPDEGVFALYVASESPPKTLEVRYHQGPDNRHNGINRMDGAKYTW